MESFVQLIITGLSMGAIYALVALGMVLIFKSTGVFNIAQGQLLLVGAFICYTLSSHFGLPFWAAIIFTVPCAFLLGLAIERLCLRPMIGKPLLGVIIMTLGLASLLKGLTVTIWGPQTRSYPTYLPSEPVRIGEVHVSYENIFAFGVATALIIGFTLFFRTRLGLAMRVVSEDQEVAQATGIRVGMIFGLAWGVSAITAAISGISLATSSALDYGIAEVGLLAFPVIVLGGLESIPGSIIAGVVVGLLEVFAARYIPLSAFQVVFPYVILIVVLIVRPYGLFGQKTIERV